MTISEVIQKLEKIKAEKGDVDVIVANDSDNTAYDISYNVSYEEYCEFSDRSRNFVSRKGVLIS
jgi:hypothetical protein